VTELGVGDVSAQNGQQPGAALRSNVSGLGMSANPP
jgi:hypothetical protein